MQTAVINVRVEPKTKKEAQSVAKNLGFSLGSLIEGYLKHLVRTKTVHFSLSEQPSEYMIKALKRSDEDIKAGRVVSFKSPKEALRYLDKIIDEHKKS